MHDLPLMDGARDRQLLSWSRVATWLGGEKLAQGENNFQPPVPPGTLIGHMCEIPEIPERSLGGH